MTASPESWPVTDYKGPTDKVEAALTYPGERPDTSFMTDGQTVTILPEGYSEFKQAADQMLTAQGLPTIDQRYPVLAYGANASPYRLKTKMAKFDPSERPDMQVVPSIVATLPNTGAVWHGRQGQGGSVFAELYQGPEVKGTKLRAFVSFLTKEQFATFHATEGVTYAVAELPATLGLGEDTKGEPVSAYVALDSQIALDSGDPILVEGVRHIGRTLQQKTVTQMAQEMLRHSGNNADIKDYLRETLEKPLHKKKQLQAAIGTVLLQKGLARKFAFTDLESGILIGRTDFTSMPGGQDKHLLQIPEMALAAIRPDAATLPGRLEKLAEKYPDRTVEERLALIDPARKCLIRHTTS